MARKATSTIKVKVSESPETFVTVNAKHTNFAEFSVETFRKLAEQTWKQFMYSTVQTTIKAQYPSIAANVVMIENMRKMFNATEEQIAQFCKAQNLLLELPNTVQLMSDLTIEFDTVVESTDEENDDADAEEFTQE